MYQAYLRPLFHWLFMIAGWLVLGLGLVFLVNGLSELARSRFIETVFFTLIGIFVFRGGVQLVKVGIAARICLQAHHDAEAAKRKALRPSRAASQNVPFDW